MKFIKKALTEIKTIFSWKGLLYIFRWQLSTPILAIVIHSLNFGTLIGTIIANFIGSTIFFFLDKLIFNGTIERMYKNFKKKVSIFLKR